MLFVLANVMVIVNSQQSKRKNKTKIFPETFNSKFQKVEFYILERVSIIGFCCIFSFIRGKKALALPRWNILFINVYLHEKANRQNSRERIFIQVNTINEHEGGSVTILEKRYELSIHSCILSPLYVDKSFSFSRPMCINVTEL